MNCAALRSVSTVSCGVRTPPHFICRASNTPPSSHEDPQFSRRAFLRRSLHLSGMLVATDMVKRSEHLFPNLSTEYLKCFVEIALAGGADIVEEAEEEVPELEAEITTLPDPEQKAVEAEVEVSPYSLLIILKFI